MKAIHHIAIVGWIAIAVLLSTAARSEQPEDGWVTARVKLALVAADGVTGPAIDVDTFDGTVTLHGMVGTRAEATRAAMTAQEVAGVRGTRNLLVVVPDERRANLLILNEGLAKLLATTLERDPMLGTSRITVESVNDGVVLLGGRAETPNAHRRALEVARSVEGVRRVVSSIHSPAVAEDARIWEETAATTTTSDSILGENARDVWLTTKTKLALLAERGLSPTSVHVETRGGVVTLFGVVEDASLRDAAEVTVMGVNGVRGVVNGLQVIPDPEVVATSIQTRDPEAARSVETR